MIDTLRIKHGDNAVAVGYDDGGVVTNSRREPEYSNKSKRPGSLKEMHW